MDGSNGRRYPVRVLVGVVSYGHDSLWQNADELCLTLGCLVKMVVCRLMALVFSYGSYLMHSVNEKGIGKSASR